MFFSPFQQPSSHHQYHLLKKIRNAHLHISLSRNLNGHFRRFSNHQNGKRTVPKKIFQISSKSIFLNITHILNYNFQLKYTNTTINTI